jgi:iron complex transport system ATP-binding protein
VLQAHDVAFGYVGTEVLRGVSLEVPADGFVGILGPNGSGKTTLLRTMSGTIRPSRGSVTLDGVDLTRIPRQQIARRMAVVPQETRLAFDFSALEVVLMGRYPHLGRFEVEGPADLAIAHEALAATGTADLAERQFTTLSGGEKQRVIIASALAQVAPRLGSDPTRSAGSRANASGSDPDVRKRTPGSDPIYLLLDEPTVALDLAYQLEIAHLLQKLQQQRRIAIAVSTHDLNFAAAFCRSLVLLKNGRVLAAGPTADVLTPDLIRQLYGVRADVTRHADAGHLVVVPIARDDDGARR